MTPTPIEHTSVCPDCEGDGQVEDLDSDDEDALCECRECEGTGEVTWYWRAEETGVCETCYPNARAIGKLPEVPLCGVGEDGETRVCLPCIQRAHAQECGCDAEGWKP